MKYLNFKSEYDKYPKINIKAYQEGIFDNYKDIYNRLVDNCKGNETFVFECYPGVRYDELKQELFSLFNNPQIICTDDYAKSGSEITSIIEERLSNDRVFGFLSHYDILDFYQESARKSVNDLVSTKNVTIVYGFGASSLVEGDKLVYLDMARWEIQQRFRSHELTNWKMDTFDLDILRKYKRSFFFEWRTADKIKKGIYDKIDFYIDTNKASSPKMVTGFDFITALKQAVQTPFRLVPYFDPGVWGGQWMKEACNLDPNKENYAWSFDGVPEENSVYVKYGEKHLEMPSINIVFYQPVELLGQRVFDEYGAEFPIRFDLLDTVGGGNLSLQVHPLKSYIKEKFNLDYTQEESYYMLDAVDDACVYLGIKEGVNKDDLIADLEAAQRGEKLFDDERFINKFPAKKHDHFLIPAGTIHCSGSNGMVLEISATPYIFTFKLWDWGRLGLDGVPRPVHINHGKEVIQWDRDTTWVKENLVNQAKILHQDKHQKIEKTGLHDLEFIETMRFTTKEEISITTNGSVNVCNLVDGSSAIISSSTNQFDDYIVHYAETFIIPEAIKEFSIKPKNSNEQIMLLRALVK